MSRYATRKADVIWAIEPYQMDATKALPVNA